MKRALAVLLTILPAMALAQGGKPATPQPSVLVTTQAPRQGSLPRTLTAYGAVQPSPDGGSETLSLLRGGQVLRLMTAAGQAVRKGQPLLAVSADPAALAAYHQAVTALSVARGERARMAQMLGQHLATRNQLAQADKAVADAQATLDALNRGGGANPEQTLTAPFDGVVSSLPVTSGIRFAAQAPLITLARSNRLVAVVGVEPAQRGLIGRGQPARIEPLSGSGAEQGSVLSVGAMLDPQSRLVPVMVDPPQPDRQGETAGTSAETAVEWMPGEPVRVVVQVGEMRGWLVPRSAVLTDAKGPYVFQVNGGKAARVDVQIVGTASGTTVIAGPLDPARPLVTRGNYQLQDGGAVREDRAGTAPESTAKP
ncbi:MAG: efflux RND transporter periplasmic adaptor subunit [Alphaproteobacteria bacterium]|nr:efflux RND transporter periplasmic adaptor subunit [Alphaproteobacteria bacterium]